MVSAIIVAGGKGTRMGAGFNKVFMELCGVEIIARTVGVFNDCDDIDEIIIVTGGDDIAKMNKICSSYSKVTAVTEGGELRQESVYNGLTKANGDIVLIHDGARCLITEDIIKAVVYGVKKNGASATGVTVKDTLKTVDADGNITATVDRERTVQIQTPQGFKKDEITEMHKRAKAEGLEVTDDCAVFEHYGKTVHLTPGSYDNIKITTPIDIAIGEEILKRRDRI